MVSLVEKNKRCFSFYPVLCEKAEAVDINIVFVERWIWLFKLTHNLVLCSISFHKSEKAYNGYDKMEKS